MKIAVDPTNANGEQESPAETGQSTSPIDNGSFSDETASQQRSFKILKRPSGGPTSSHGFQRCSSANSLKSLEQREAAYAEARMRIFGANGAEASDGEVLSDSSQSSIPTPPLVVQKEKDKDDTGVVILKRPNPSLRQQLQLKDNSEQIQESGAEYTPRALQSNVASEVRPDLLCHPFIRPNVPMGPRAPLLDMTKFPQPPLFPAINRPPPPVMNPAIDPSSFGMYKPPFFIAPHFTVPPPPPGHPLAYGTLPPETSKYFENPVKNSIAKSFSATALPVSKEMARPHSSGSIVAAAAMNSANVDNNSAASLFSGDENNALRTWIEKAIGDIVAKPTSQPMLAGFQHDITEAVLPIVNQFISRRETKLSDELAALRLENEALQMQLLKLASGGVSVSGVDSATSYPR